jgi:uncharacterized protein (TIGR02217 family)
MVQAFHEVLFPVPLALTGRGGPQRQTEIAVQASGFERRLSRWRHARRRYEIGSGLKTRSDLMQLVQFFEARRGRLYGFRFHDPLDGQSVVPITPLDQTIGVGDGVTASFALSKTYGAGVAAYQRPILKPCAGTVRVAINGVECVAGKDFACDSTTGLVTFYAGHVPPAQSVITAGYQFDVPVRFESDVFAVNFDAWGTSEVPVVTLLELIG